MSARHHLSLLLLLLAAGLMACQSSDSRSEILKQRARWNVQVQSWASGDDGSLTVGTRISGPVNSTLDQLTFQILMFDADNNLLGEEWRTVSLSEVPRGGPVDRAFKVQAPPEGVENLGISLVLAPTPEQESHIPELPAVSP